MVIHIGNDHVIQSEAIISIIDYNVVTSSGIMEKMVEKKAEQEKVYGPADEAKSVVVTSDNVYYSSLSVSTLKKRAGLFSMIDKLDDFSDEIE